MIRQRNMTSSLISKTRRANIGRTLCVSHSSSSARRPGSLTSAMPKRNSANVAVLTYNDSNG